MKPSKQIIFGLLSGLGILFIAYVLLTANWGTTDVWTNIKLSIGPAIATCLFLSSFIQETKNKQGRVFSFQEDLTRWSWQRWLFVVFLGICGLFLGRTINTFNWDEPLTWETVQPSIPWLLNSITFLALYIREMRKGRATLP